MKFLDNKNAYSQHEPIKNEGKLERNFFVDIVGGVGLAVWFDRFLGQYDVLFRWLGRVIETMAGCWYARFYLKV